jgi:hypothetical protein
MGVVLAPMLPHPHPNPPLEGEGGFFSGRSALIGKAIDRDERDTSLLNVFCLMA